MIAQKAGCPIIPVAITDTEKIFENHVPFVRAGKVTISFGKPIDMTALDRNQRRQVPALVQETVADMIAQVRMKDS
jgi:1-acyl-sn-glycerol-3-phosphate acyltransferase